MQDTLPNVHADLIDIPSLEQLSPRTPSLHKPRILLLYGSTRERSFSRLVTQEAARLLNEFGAETKIFTICSYASFTRCSRPFWFTKFTK